MFNRSCKVLLVEDDSDDTKQFQQLLSHKKPTSFCQGFEIICVDTLALALEQLTRSSIDVIILDLMLPDSRGMGTLTRIREAAPSIPVLIQTALDDETVAVKALELGATGYLHKVELDTNLLVYAIRTAIERQQKLDAIQQVQLAQHEDEFRELEALVNKKNTPVTAKLFGLEPLREAQADIFAELLQTYGDVLDLALEKRAYKVEHKITEHLHSLATQLGVLKATPRDIVELHSAVLKQKTQGVLQSKAQAYMVEGRLMVLELMGYLCAYYRKYFIGLNKINIAKTYNEFEEK
jgi:DNA-binding response OmpR family regulator